MGLFGSDPPKAQILCLEDGDLNVEAQFNPNELSYDRSTSWGGGEKEEVAAAATQASGLAPGARCSSPVVQPTRSP